MHIWFNTQGDWFWSLGGDHATNGPFRSYVACVDDWNEYLEIHNPAGLESPRRDALEPHERAGTGIPLSPATAPAAPSGADQARRSPPGAASFHSFVDVDLERGSSEAEQRSHNPQAEGSIPSPAPKSRRVNVASPDAARFLAYRERVSQ